jgi:hypothetical protein
MNLAANSRFQYRQAGTNTSELPLWITAPGLTTPFAGPSARQVAANATRHGFGRVEVEAIVPERRK